VNSKGKTESLGKTGKISEEKDERFEDVAMGREGIGER